MHSNIWSEIPAISGWMNSSWCCDLVHCAAIFSFVKVRQIKKTHTHRTKDQTHIWEHQIERATFFYDRMQISGLRTPAFYRIKWTTRTSNETTREEKKHQRTHLMTDILSADVILKQNFWNSTKQKRSICIFLANSLVIGQCYMSAKSRTYFLMIKIWNIFVGSFLSGEIQLIIGCFSFSWMKLRLWRISTVDKYIQSVGVVVLCTTHCENKIKIGCLGVCFFPFFLFIVFMLCDYQSQESWSNSFNCYILFLLWTVQLNVLRWLNGIGTRVHL